MMKKLRIWTVFTVLILLLAFLPGTANAEEIVASGASGENLTWVLDNSGTLTISGTGMMDDYFYSTAPWDGKRDMIVHIVIEDGVTSIGQRAFYECSALKSVTIPPSISQIGYEAFSKCGNTPLDVHIADLAAWFRIEFGNRSASPFSYLSACMYLNGELIFGELVVPDGTKKIGESIYNWWRLERVIVPASVEMIGAGFDCCQELKEIVFLGDAPEITEDSFQLVRVTAYYPAGNSTWTSEVMKNYQGDITWVAYEPVDSFGIVLQPVDQILYTGETATFHVLAIGDKLEYRWQYCEPGSSWQDIATEEAETDTISVSVSEETNGEQYRCIITDKNGNMITTKSALLAIDTTVCYEYTPQRVADTLRYLEDIYIERYPDLGLRFLFGDEEDKRYYQNLSDVITEGCITDREKADAIFAWIRRNIEYNGSFSTVESTLNYRAGDCVGYALLMQTLFRLEGIPAVWGDGWRGDMEHVNHKMMFNSVGHAWCWAYIDGVWELYDPLWLSEGITDTEYMAKWMYFDMLEGIRPVYYTEDFPPMYAESYVCYNGDKFMVYRGDTVDSTANTPVTVINFGYYLFVSRRYTAEGGYNDGITFLDENRDKDELINGELYRDGWINDGSLCYAYENGIHACGTTMSLNGKDYYFDVQSTCGFEILADASEYSLTDGYFTLRTGYQGKPLETTGETNLQEYTVIWKSSDSSVATITEAGVITALQPGQTSISAHFYRNSDGVYVGSGSTYVLMVSDEVFAADYSDNYTEHEHIYEMFVASSGATFMTCTETECADSYEIVLTGWQKLDGSWHYFDSNGVMQTGWLASGGRWYYLDESGVMVTGWQRIDGQYYYFNSSGAMQKGWLKLGNNWFYLKPDGAMVTGTYKIDGAYYGFNASGAMVTGWQVIDGKWHLFNGNGTAKSGWLANGSKWYYLAEDGEMTVGLKKISGYWYYFDGNGYMTTGWQKVNGSWHLFGGSGTAKTGWYAEGGKWYYLAEDGEMTIGWKAIGGSWYYLNSNGYMTTGWQKVGGNWFYMNGSGVMQTGWLKLGNNWYYFNSSGVMLTGTHTIGGRSYTFNASGIWIA